MEATAKRPMSFTKKYLVAYNAIQTVGWLVVLWQFCNYYVMDGKSSSNPYETVKWPLYIFQTAAILEIIHSVIGIVPSSVIFTVVQVHSRIMVIWYAVLPTMWAKESIGLPMCLFAWSFAELIRYGYYTLHLTGTPPKFLAWLRYTAFIILYPIGVAGELFCISAAERQMNKEGLGLTDTPDFVPFTFPYRLFMVVALVVYIPSFAPLYLHMLKQRKKILGKESQFDAQKRIN